MIQTLDTRKYRSGKPLKDFFIKRFKNRILHLVKKTRAKRVLDSGCGEGFLLSFLNEEINNWFLEGFDISQELVSKAREKLPFFNFSVRDIYDSGYPKGNFDLVLSTEVLEHLEEPERALAEISRLTNEWVIVSVPNEPWFSLANLASGKHIKRLGTQKEHINKWSTRGFVELISRYFEVVEVANSFPWAIVLGRKKNGL